ncbi:FecR family protein [Steroidobacter flavus]|uniref:FecR family protein n=1 Tax=Steroidobacter flavus TaxID=1842136 RepID=A0ABV8SZK9_9GAMM
MHRETRSTLNNQISEEAAEWFVDFRTGEIDASGRRAFDDWVRRSPEHLRAYLEFATIWNQTAAIDAARALDIDALIALARSEGSVVSFESAEPSPRPRAMRKWRTVSLAASLLVVLVSALTWFLFYRMPVYATQVAEERSFRLPDGSTVELNARSRLRVRFTDAERTVDLLEGQALFHVAKSPQRPFVVHSGQTRVRAVGTKFDVYRKPQGTVVTVVEGRVAVSVGSASPEAPSASSASEPGAKMFLSAGEQVTVTAHEIPRLVQANVEAVTAWTQRQLVLDAMPLIQVAEEFNRYSTRKLIVEDLGSPALRLSGVFAADPDFLIRYLRDRRDITVQETETEIHIVRRPAH